MQIGKRALTLTPRNPPAPVIKMTFFTMLALQSLREYARACDNRISSKGAGIYAECGERMAGSRQPLCHGRDPVDENSVTVQSGMGRGPDGLLPRVLRSGDPTDRPFEVSVFVTYGR